MELIDRFTSEKVLEKDLSNVIELGRYYYANDKIDITYSNLVTNKVIKQDLLLERNKNIADIFIDIAIDVDKDCGELNVIPLIRRIKNKLGLNAFEKLLFEKLFHLEEIFRSPHYLLRREIEKVNISKAKRIPTKSYDYLASHTEDWIHKSIVNFKPSRVLHEELNLDFDIYENQFVVIFVRRCLVYFNSRIKEVQDIKSFLNEYEKLLKDRNDQNNWYKKTQRNLELIGCVYEDDNYKGSNSDSFILNETECVLNQIYKRLLLLQKSELFGIVKAQSLQNIQLKNTNVLVNHKHYRYVKNLWIELEKSEPEKLESEKVLIEQKLINSVRKYAKTAIVYALKNNLVYELRGDYNLFIGEHHFYNDVIFSDAINHFELTIGDFKSNIIVIASEPECPEDLEVLLVKHNSFLFYYSENSSLNFSRIININPLDPDSIERIGKLIKQELLLIYSKNIQEKYRFPSLLKDYVKYINENFIHFNLNEFEYNFIKFPKNHLIFNELKDEIVKDSQFTKINNDSKREIISEFERLIDDINIKINILKNERLYCFGCGEKLPAYNINDLNYLKCLNCNSLFDNTGINEIKFLIDYDKYKNLKPLDFGMDYLAKKYFL